MLFSTSKKKKQAKMVISMSLFRSYIVLFALFASRTVESSILRGPNNIAGIVGEDVTLECRSDESQKVKWTFTPFGETVAVEESKFPGHYRTSSSSRGYHSLTLEDLTFHNAGHYECRVVGSSGGGIDAATAFVVVVANPPHCVANATGRLSYSDLVTMNCSVTFVGQHNLTLEWLAPDDRVLRQQHYWSGDVPHVARLSLNVMVRASSSYNLSISSYKCRAYFANWTTQFVDEASNSPEFARNNCTVPLPAPTVSPTDAFTQATQPIASSNANLILAVVVGILTAGCAALVVAVIVCAYLNRAKIRSALRRGRRQIREPSVDAANTSNNSQNDGATGDIERTLLVSAHSKDDMRTGGETSFCLSERGREASQVTDELSSGTVPQHNEPERQLYSGPASHKSPEVAAAANTKKVVDQQPSHSRTDTVVVCPGGSHPRPSNPVEPPTTGTSQQENAGVFSRTSGKSRQESVVNSSDSANNTVDSAVVLQSQDPPGNDSGNRLTPHSSPEPETSGTYIQENADAVVPGEESVVNSSDSANFASSSAAPHDDTYDMVDLHEDQPTETGVEDEID